MPSATDKTVVTQLLS